MDHVTAVTWRRIGIGIAGLVIGYAFVLLQQGPTVFAKKNSCPAQHNQVCIGSECTKDCHGNCDKLSV